MTPVWPHGDPREVARSVLLDPRFHAVRTRPQRTFADAVADAIRAVWDALTAPLQHLTGNRTVSAVVGVAVLLAVLFAMLLVAVRFAREAASRQRAARAPAAPVALLASDLDAAALHALALDALGAGRLREAAALLWGSALRALDERGRVRFDAARSPGEWRRAVRDPAFDAFARDAVVALFGDRDVDAALVGRMRDGYARLVAA